MKKRLIILALAILAGTGVAFAHDGEHHGEESSQSKSYYCPMHPEVTQDKAGKCPKCEMNLEKKETKETEHTH